MQGEPGMRATTTLSTAAAGDATASGRDGRRDALHVHDERTGREYDLPVELGAVRARDLGKITDDAPEPEGLVSYDPAFLNTASCKSAITFIDGDKGILRYRGY